MVVNEIFPPIEKADDYDDENYLSSTESEDSCFVDGTSSLNWNNDADFFQDDIQFDLQIEIQS